MEAGQSRVPEDDPSTLTRAEQGRVLQPIARRLEWRRWRRVRRHIGRLEGKGGPATLEDNDAAAARRAPVLRHTLILSGEQVIDAGFAAHEVAACKTHAARRSHADPALLRDTRAYCRRRRRRRRHRGGRASLFCQPELISELRDLLDLGDGLVKGSALRRALAAHYSLNDLCEPRGGCVVGPLGTRVRVLERTAGRLEHLMARTHRMHGFLAGEAHEHGDAHGIGIRLCGVHPGGHCATWRESKRPAVVSEPHRHEGWAEGGHGGTRARAFRVPRRPTVDGVEEPDGACELIAQMAHTVLVHRRGFVQGQPDVRELGVEMLVEQYVGRLDVAVEDNALSTARRVEEEQRAARGAQNAHAWLPKERRARSWRQRILQSTTRHERIDQAASLLVEAEAEQRQQVLMAAEREYVNLVLQLVHALLRVLSIHDLDGHPPSVAKRGQATLIHGEDGAEAALSQLGREVAGGGAQGLFIHMRRGREHRLCGLLLKLDFGIKDAWITPVMKAREVRQYYHDVFDDSVVLRAVDVDYLVMMVNHFLAMTVDKGHMADLHLLEIQEETGLQFVPSALDTGFLMRELSVKIAPFTQDVVQSALKRSHAWSKKKSFTDSWYLEGADVDKLVNRCSTMTDGVRVCQFAEAMLFLFEEQIEQQRERWLFHFLWVALWLKSKSRAHETMWRDSFLIAYAIQSGTPMRDIPIMHDVVHNTIVNSMETMHERRTHLN